MERSYERLGEIEPAHDEIAELAQTVRGIGDDQIVAVARAKRAFDIIVSALALVLLAPVICIAAVIIKLESRGPVFYTQERVGINRRRRDRRGVSKSIASEHRSGHERRRKIHPGKPFNIYKLRTMRIDSEKDGPLLAAEDDPRITRMGRVMRKARIDEIPQFVNVIAGDMSIIGPRPERSFFISKYKKELPDFDLRLRVKPGITGLAQVESGYTQTVAHMRRRLLFDLKYISRLSLFQELEIILKTVFVVITGKGAC